jgi:ABC-type Fe3+-citrate transport system substrate-binding protein
MKYIFSILLATLSFALAQAAFPVAVEHELGTLELETAPQRIVALEYSFVDALLALGVKPVGMAKDDIPPYLADEVADVPSVGSRYELNLEAILALEPDLILADLSRNQEIYGQLSKIAPTAVFDSYYGEYDETLEQFQKIAALVGQPALAKEQLAAHTQLFEKAKNATSKDAGPLVAAVVTDTGFWVQSTDTFMGSLMERLGRDNPVSPQAGEGIYQLSLEGLAAINPASILVVRTPGEPNVLSEWEKGSVWDSLTAVKDDRVYTVDRGLWSLGRGVQALNLILDEALETGVLKNQPTR